MEIRTVQQFRGAVQYGPYAWPGGYPLFFLTDEGEALSFEALDEPDVTEAIERAIEHGLRDGWRVVGVAINWEDSDLRCAHTGERIPSAYADEFVPATTD
jgi:hypothetical protein